MWTPRALCEKLAPQALVTWHKVTLYYTILYVYYIIWHCGTSGECSSRFSSLQTIVRSVKSNTIMLRQNQHQIYLCTAKVELWSPQVEQLFWGLGITTTGPKFKCVHRYTQLLVNHETQEKIVFAALFIDCITFPPVFSTAFGYTMVWIWSILDYSCIPFGLGLLYAHCTLVGFP